MVIQPSGTIVLQFNCRISVDVFVLITGTCRDIFLDKQICLCGVQEPRQFEVICCLGFFRTGFRKLSLSVFLCTNRSIPFSPDLLVLKRAESKRTFGLVIAGAAMNPTHADRSFPDGSSNGVVPTSKAERSCDGRGSQPRPRDRT